MREGGRAARTFSDDLRTLLRRAALTIPVWFAIRQGIAGIFRTIRDGLKDLSSFDRSLQKLRRNISATADSPEQIAENFAKVRDEITKFSLETGVAVEGITNAIQRFATVGFDFETSLRAGIAATKLSILEFGDAEKTADAFARSLRVLTEGLGDNVDQAEAIERALALTDELWKTNAFEVNEFTNNLNKFAGTARAANLSIDETIKLLATLSTGGLGERAGRLLRTAILRSLADFDNVNRTLRLGVNPAVDTTLDFILRLVSALKQLSVEGVVPTELAGVLGDLFSVRSTEILAALTALEDTLKENIAVTGDIDKFNDSFKDLTDEIFLQSERFTNLNREIGKAFVTGLVGGENFAESLANINNLLGEIIPKAQALGAGLRIAGTAATLQFNKLSDEFENLDNVKLTNIQKEARQLFNLEEIADPQIIEDLLKNFEEAVPGGLFGFGEAFRDEVRRQLETRLAELQTVSDANPIKPTIDAGTGITTEINRLTTQQKQINELILKNQLERLKTQGALESQLLRAEQNLRRQLGLDEELADQLSRQLEIERAITEEQRLRTELSSDTVKLFRIAQTEGTNIAKAIGQVLAGQRDFNIFVRQGGRELEVFRDQFGDIFEQQQALRFFRGDVVPELPGLRGGTNIPIEEEEALRQRTPIFDTTAALAQARATRQFATLRDIQQTNTITIQQNIQGSDPEEIANQCLDKLREALGDPNSETSRDLKQLCLGDENVEF